MAQKNYDIMVSSSIDVFDRARGERTHALDVSKHPGCQLTLRCERANNLFWRARSLCLGDGAVLHYFCPCEPRIRILL